MALKIIGRGFQVGQVVVSGATLLAQVHSASQAGPDLSVKLATLLGVRNARDGHAFTCSGKKKDGCDAPNIGYDENFLLGVMAQFRWSNFFGNEKHDAELANARRIVLALTSELGAFEDKVESRREQIKAADKNTPLTVLVLWD